MAVIELNRRGYLYTITATGLYNLGPANDAGIGSMIWQADTALLTGNFVVKKRVIGGTADAEFLAAQAAREGSTDIIEAGTTCSDADIYAVFADGCQVALDVTVTSGSMTIRAWGGKG